LTKMPMPREVTATEGMVAAANTTADANHNLECCG
jgi:hypothetical protein